MPKELKHPYKNKRKGVLFFSASSLQHAEWLLEYGITDILISYHYITKNTRRALNIMQEVKLRGGTFMTDSGAFSFMAMARKGDVSDDFYKSEFWIPKLEEYVQFLTDNKDLIYVSANYDLDKLLDREQVNRWNERYFRPLEKDMNIAYVAHKDFTGKYSDQSGMKRLKDYLKRHEYVGINAEWANDVKKTYSLAKQYKRRIHGFALTSPKSMLNTPFFSHDSTTWLGALRYGETYTFDGRNFKANPKEKKYLRKARMQKFKDRGFSKTNLEKEKYKELAMHSLMAWEGLRDRYEKVTTRLWNKPIPYYDKRSPL